MTAFGIIFDCKLCLTPRLGKLGELKLIGQSRLMEGKLDKPYVATKLTRGRGIKVQAPREMVTEPWFIEAIHDAPDYL